MGVLISTLASSPELGALLFSFGLLAIIELKLPLYTGQIGFIQERKKRDLIIIFLANLFGITLFTLIIGCKPDMYELLRAKANIKFDKSYLTMLTDGFVCGMLIHFAVKMKQKLLTVMAVMIFILTGAEHCIADFPYLMVLDFNWINFLKYLVIVLGNSIGALFI